MQVEQLYTSCLAQGAYYIESDGEAAIIDPLREVDQYVDMAKRRGAKIKYIFETHFHADFVSGHVDLSKKTGAPIIYGPTSMQTGFDVTIGEDGQVFPLGKASIKLLHTPGHTLESSCYLLTNEDGKETSIFTGDTLFIGDVGRPDLAQHVIADLTEEKLARHLYKSLREKIMPLADDIIVYPGHGAGSACGKNLSSETSDTLGNQKKTNYALQPDKSEDEFVQELLKGLMPPPSYFPKNVLMNIGGYDSLDDVLTRGTRALNAQEFEMAATDDKVLILDTRAPEDFITGHIPNALNIGLNGSFAVWVGTLVKDIKQPLLIVCDEGTQFEVITRLARVGYDHAIGFLNGGFEAWKEAGLPVNTIESISVEALQAMKAKTDWDNSKILDVRKESEYNSEHVVGAQNAPLDYIQDHLSEVDQSSTRYVHCASGYRSVVFISLLKRFGYQNLVNVEGGFNAIKKDGSIETTEYVCPTTML